MKSLLYILLILAVTWILFKCYKLFNRDHNIIAKQLVTELINESVTISNIVDPIHSYRLVDASIAKWNTFERILPYYASKYEKVRNMLFAQHEHVCQFISNAAMEENK